MGLSKYIRINILWFIALLVSWVFIINTVQAQQADRSSEIFNKETTSIYNTIEVKTVDNRIIVSNAPVNAKMEIYNIIGKKVSEFVLKQSSGEYILSLPKGYYIVRIAGTVRKIVIR